jgi:hypothetical protein
MKQQGIKDVIHQEGRTLEEVEEEKVWKDRGRQKCLIL